MEAISQRLALRRLPMFEVHPTGANLQRLATATLEAFNDRRLRLYPDPDLMRDVQRFRVVEKSYGFRLVSPRDNRGHGDLGTAFTLALVAAQEVAGKFQRVIGVAGGDHLDHVKNPNTLESRIAKRFGRAQESYAREMERLAEWTPERETRFKATEAFIDEFGSSYLDRLAGGR